MASISIDLVGDLAVVKELEGKAVALPMQVFGVVRTFGAMLQTKIVAKASGRPGPRARTGDYRRSWSTITSFRGTSAEAEAGTNAPQGRRLEFGFTGIDALGRRYNQPPFPHARPALDEIDGPFGDALEALVDLR